MSTEMPPPGGQILLEFPFKAVNLYIGAGQKYDKLDPSLGKRSVVALIQGEVKKADKIQILWVVFWENSDDFAGVNNNYATGVEYHIIYLPSILLSEVLSAIKEKRSIFLVETKNFKSPGQFNIGFFLRCAL
jgi:hypothetical protein